MKVDISKFSLLVDCSIMKKCHLSRILAQDMVRSSGIVAEERL
jgi:hypothetical protein